MSIDYFYELYKKVETGHKAVIKAKEQVELKKQNPFRIVFCGVFSSGKSSLINALLRRDYLPTGITPVTKVVTRIQYSFFRKYYCINGDKKLRISKKKMRRIVQGKETLPEGYNEMLLMLRCSMLKNNVEFVDTPGYQDNASLEEISRAAVINGDLAVMCFNGVIFGKMFEKEYLDELNRSFGNICIVVNRMDCLNTDEDYQIIKEYARELIAGRGNAATPEDKEGKCFLTVSCGKYKNLNGFAEYIKSVLSDQQLMQRIRQTSCDRYVSFLNEKLKTDYDIATDSIQKEIEHFEAIRQTEKEKAQAEYELQKKLVESTIQKVISRADTMASDALVSVEAAFRQIKDDYSADSFVGKASDEARKCVNELIKTISAYAEEQGCGNRDSLQNIIRPDNLKKYSVPAPVAHTERRKSYGVIGRTIQTAFNFLTGSFKIDDGCVNVTVYNDYVPPAVQSVKDKLITKVQAQLESYLFNRWSYEEDKRLVAEMEKKAEQSVDTDTENELKKMLSDLPRFSTGV